MKRIEYFALFAGVVGLVTDAITLLLLVTSGTSDAQQPGLRLELIMLSMLYGWFLVAWMLVRRYLAVHGVRDVRSEFLPKWAASGRMWQSVYGVGILLAPLQLLVFAILFPPSGWKHGASDWTFNFFLGTTASIVGVGVILVCALVFLMPMVYRDLQ